MIVSRNLNHAGLRLCRFRCLSLHLLWQVNYQLELAEWLFVTGCEPGSKEHTTEALLLAAVTTLTQLEEAAAEGAAACLLPPYCAAHVPGVADAISF